MRASTVRRAVPRSRRPGPRRLDDRAAATVLVASLLGLLLLVGSALGVVTAMVVDHRRAQAAADLAALAAAQRLAAAGDACGATESVALADRARLVRCQVVGRDVLVEVVVEGPRWLGAHGDLDAQARAGPAAP